MAINGVQALTFDTFGTVVDWRSSIIADFRAFGRLFFASLRPCVEGSKLLIS
jgi:hypothetical protein